MDPPLVGEDVKTSHGGSRVREKEVEKLSFFLMKLAQFHQITNWYNEQIPFHLLLFIPPVGVSRGYTDHHQGRGQQ